MNEDQQGGAGGVFDLLSFSNCIHHSFSNTIIQKGLPGGEKMNRLIHTLRFIRERKCFHV